jgi:hypothetical protein
MWKIIVGAASASALTAVIVASCLDRDRAQRELTEPGIVETTSGAAHGRTTTTTAADAPASTSDSTGGVDVDGRGDGRAAQQPAQPTRIDQGTSQAGAPTETTGATIVVPNGSTTINNTTNVTSDPSAPAMSTQSTQSYSPRPSPFESVVTTNGSTDPNDTDNRNAGGGARAGTEAGAAPIRNPNTPGSNPEAPPMNAGAGRFVTEAPFWGASSFPSNPDAGAGQFQTERNSPAH